MRYSALWTGVNGKVSEKLEETAAKVRSKLVDRIESAQQVVQSQAMAVQEQADAVRRQVAIAVWWLFLSLLFSGTGSEIAGWVATRY